MAFTPFTPHSQIFFVFSILCKTLPLIAFLYNIPYIYIYIPYGYYRIFLGVALQFIGLSLLIGSRDRVFDSNSYLRIKRFVLIFFVSLHIEIA